MQLGLTREIVQQVTRTYHWIMNRVSIIYLIKASMAFENRIRPNSSITKKDCNAIYHSGNQIPT